MTVNNFTNVNNNTSENKKKSLKIPKGTIKIRKSKNRQHNGKKKKYKKTNNDLQIIRLKLKIKQHETH
jgi:hypothetical protein